MCGIVGKINFNNKEIKKEEMINMLQVLRHRGPDGSNIYINRNIGLGHVLLKIQDLSDNSLQPFEYKNYTFFIFFFFYIIIYYFFRFYT